MCRALQSMPLLMRRRSQTGSGRPCRCRIASTTFSIRLSMRASLRDSPITLICHSLGGLIIKQVMLSLKEQEDRRPEASVLLNRIRQIVFIATPHTGARSATWLARASFLVWPTATARALVSNDPYLRKVNVSYRGSRASGEHGFRIGSIFETLSIWFGLRIVDEGSSDPGLDENPVPIHADHITIAKPDKRKSDVYTGVLNLVSNYPSPKFQAPTAGSLWRLSSRATLEYRSEDRSPWRRCRYRHRLHCRSGRAARAGTSRPACQ